MSNYSISSLQAEITRLQNYIGLLEYELQKKQSRITTLEYMLNIKNSPRMQDLDAPPLTPLPQEPDNEPTEQDESGSRVSPTQQIARFLPRENSSSRIKRASSYTWTNLDDTDGVMF